MSQPYAVPIAAPQSPPSGFYVILKTPSLGIPYDIGQEFPNDPLRLLLAWSSGYWQVVSIYNGQ
jgi:hypothetical protein